MERTTEHFCEAKLIKIKLYFEFHVLYRTYHLIPIHSPRNHLEFRTGRVFTYGSFARKLEKERKASGSGEGGKVFHANEPARSLTTLVTNLDSLCNLLLEIFRSLPKYYGSGKQGFN